MRISAIRIAAWILGRDPYGMMQERQYFRFIQFGGEAMSEIAIERFWNEMPTEDFITVVLNSGEPEIEDEMAEDDQEGEELAARESADPALGTY